jgi:hypothetical protein
VSNHALHIDLKTPYVSEVIKEYSTNYFHKLANQPNPLLQPLTTTEELDEIGQKISRTEGNIAGC